MSQDELFINGELLRLRREERGWVLNDMATRACMSVKQIRQLEEGGVSAFYSVAVKVTAAKKVAALLGLSADDVFAKTAGTEAESASPEVEVSEHAEASAEPAIPVHEVASPESAESVAAIQSEVPSVVSVEAASGDAAPKSKTSLLTIAVLFAVALAAAAYLQPKEEPFAETVPPIQVLPSEASDPASAASGSEAVASGLVEATPPASVPTLVAKPASAMSAASVSVAASVPRVATPVASTSTVSRPASAAVASPATSAASKAP